MSGNTAIVGNSPAGSYGMGEAYIYERNNGAAGGELGLVKKRQRQLSAQRNAVFVLVPSSVKLIAALTTLAKA